MESPNDQADNAPVRHFQTLNETFSARNGSHLTELLSKVPPWKSENNSGYCQGYELLSITWY